MVAVSDIVIDKLSCLERSGFEGHSTIPLGGRVFQYVVLCSLIIIFILINFGSFSFNFMPIRWEGRICDWFSFELVNILRMLVFCLFLGYVNSYYDLFYFMTCLLALMAYARTRYIGTILPFLTTFTFLFYYWWLCICWRAVFCEGVRLWRRVCLLMTVWRELRTSAFILWLCFQQNNVWLRWDCDGYRQHVYMWVRGKESDCGKFWYCCRDLCLY